MATAGVTPTETIPLIPPDPALDGVRGLLGEEGVEAVRSFLDARGWELRGARPVQALYRPGSSCLVRYKVGALPASGPLRNTSVCLETRVGDKEPVPPSEDFAARFGLPAPIDRTGRYLAWAFPYDPALKGLSDAADGRWARAGLERLGERPSMVRVEPLRYRPRRRAVFRYASRYPRSAPERYKIAFAKVMRTAKAAKAVEVGERLKPQGAGLVLRAFRRGRSIGLSLPLGQLGTNALLFSPVAGRSLRELLVDGASLPRPERVSGLLGTLQQQGRAASDLVSERHRRPPAESVALTAELLTRIVPEASDDVSFVVEAVARGAEDDVLPAGVVHGDLYEAQMFVTEDFAFSLIDLDDLGIGDPALDAANVCAHLLALAMSRPAAEGRLIAYRELVRAEFLKSLDASPMDLAWREAMMMLQLATGPFRVLHSRWPELVRRRIRVARELVASES